MALQRPLLQITVSRSAISRFRVPATNKTEGGSKVPLARQGKSQITRYFTTQILYYYKFELDSKDYKLK